MRTFSLLALSALLAATPALARPGGVSPEEIAAERTELFAAADADGDGTLSVTEFTTFSELAHAARLERRFGHLDQDGDGLVSSEELASGERRRPHRGPR